MGLFGKKKEQPKWIDISGKQLAVLLEKAVETAREEVNAKAFIFGPEIMLDYKGNTHFAGARYDKKAAKKAGVTEYDPAFASVYLDKAEYKTVEELYDGAVLEGDSLRDIECGIVVPPEFAELLEK